MTPQPATPTLDPTIYGPGFVVDPSNPKQAINQPGAPADPYADFPTAPKVAPVAKGASSSAAPTDDPYADFPAEAPKSKPPSRQVGTGEAIAAGAVHGVTFGAAPAIAGATAAGEAQTPKDLQSAQDQADAMEPSGMIGRMLTGAYKAWMGDPVAKDAYDRGREAALADQKLAQEAHPIAYLGGQLAGTMAMPLPGAGAMRAGAMGARALGGLRAGAVGGGLYGAGEALGEGGSAGDIAKSAGIGAAIGAPLGAGLGAAVGPRVINATSPGQQAARTAESLGAPLPAGLASDNAAINATTAKARSLPILGTRISSAVDKTQEAAGEAVGDIAGNMTQGVTGRSGADSLVRHGLQSAVDANKATIDAGYNALRGQLKGAHYTMPRTDAMLTRVMQERHAAGHVNSAQGLDQFRNVAGGATFNGAHRARVDARDAGNALVPHPGYNAADFNKITRAMTADLRAIVQADAKGSPQRALKAFDDAERQFGELAERNGQLKGLISGAGEGAIAKLIGASQEKGGNLKLLAQLKATMPPDDFQLIGGTILNEIGHSPAAGNFSLARFTTGWDKLSTGAKRTLFSPHHLNDIENIVGLGQHIKGALRESNTSHTAGVLVMLDLAENVLRYGSAIGTAVAAGTGGTGLALTGASAAAGTIFIRWLSRPAVASSMSAWTRSYRVLTLGQPTPARIAAFNIATRNLAHNLGVPAESIVRAAQRRLAAPANNEDQNNKQPRPGK